MKINLAILKRGLFLFLIYASLALFFVLLGSFLTQKGKLSLDFGKIKSYLVTETNNNLSIQTSLHNIVIKKSKLSFGHIEIIEEEDNLITFAALKGVGSFNHKIAPPMEFYKVIYNINTHDIEEKFIYRNDDSVRALDVIVLSKNEFLISYVKLYSNDKVAIAVDKIILDNSDNYKIEKFYKGKQLELPFAINESGGKMIFLDDTLYLSVGTFNKTHDDNSEYGKILSFKKNSNSFVIFAKGIRNPQGLIYSKKFKKLIETEHGPQGGDEINIINYGNNYGWPNVSYGLPYNSDPDEIYKDKNAHLKYGVHDGYTEPIYTFIPSIGIKAIGEIPLNSIEFKRWRGDLIVTSYKGTFRIRLKKEHEEMRVIYLERIFDFARDIAISKAGIIFTNNFDVIRNKSLLQNSLL